MKGYINLYYIDGRQVDKSDLPSKKNRTFVKREKETDWKGYNFAHNYYKSL